ncbi:CYTH domain-containing protein [Cyanobium sp. HWJ4-Hawea]|uniref:CYTH domain-containing protein n=1 Tax=Cyanobium sp. HWJ4-Hawea TaxID=2823713 RepID=UPI0020CC783B|nr:CYTH domain-containing protein [Cyanobium sp. HWJ4-Hawea]MCP9808562.1 CYTH domain-containing protein [Cyanobium sp. HWJ4-Hawea]
MALEIERRFLVRGEEWRELIAWQAHLQQGYLVSGPEGLTLRVRTATSTATAKAEAGQQAWLTLKTAASDGGLVRQEFEYDIPLADAQDLLAIAPSQLSKRRHGLSLAGGDWVLDVFEGSNAPLVVAEVELEHAEQSLLVPSWCHLELTGHSSLSNAALAHSPLADWPELQRQALLAGLADWPTAGQV